MANINSLNVSGNSTLGSYVGINGDPDNINNLAVTGSANISGKLKADSITLNSSNSSEYTNDSVVPKSYVDSISSGIVLKEACQCATTSENFSSYNETNQFTKISTALQIDTYTVVNNDRVLVKNQSIPVQNGIYIYNSTAGTLTRSDDLAYGSSAKGVGTFVQNGTANGKTSFLQTEISESTNAVITGTDNLKFTEQSTIDFSLDSTLQLTNGNTLSVNKNLSLTSLSTSNSTTVGGNLTVTGTTTLGPANYNGTILTVNGNTNIGGKISAFSTSTTDYQGGFYNGSTGEGVLLSANGTITEIKLNNNGIAHYSIQNDNGIFKIINSGSSVEPYKGYQNNPLTIDNYGLAVFNYGLTVNGSITTLNKGLTVDGGDLTFTKNLYMNNANIMYAKNTSGTYESFYIPRWSNNATYLNFGTGGFYIRNSIINTSTNDYDNVIYIEKGKMTLGKDTTTNLTVNGNMYIKPTEPTSEDTSFKIELSSSNCLIYKKINSNSNDTVIQNNGGGALQLISDIGNGVYISGNNSYVGINNTTPQYTLDVTGNANITNGLTVSSGNTYISSGNLGVGSNTTDKDGNTYKLYVNGKTYLNGNFTVLGNSFMNSLLTVTTNLIVGSSNSSSSYALDVFGNTSLGGTLNITGATTLTGALNANGGIKCDTDKFTVADSTGNTSIAGTLAVTQATTISSTCKATSFEATSDYRIKENILNLKNKSNFTVDNLRPITYTNKLSGNQDIGLIAHELQEHYPFLVSGEKDGTENQSVNYIGLIGILIKEIQELKEKVKTLESNQLFITK